MDTPRYARRQVMEIISSVLSKVDGQDASREVYMHLAELADIIDSLKKDISAASPHHVKNSHIPDATDELDAVVTATAEATNKIMTVCEEIENIAQDLPAEKRDAFSAQVTQIYEACSFQDITGQRIKNVVATLQVIESKVDGIMSVLRDKVGLKMADGKVEKIVSANDDKSLLNGPQLEGKGVSQEEIDRLLAEFD
jgi:chemotaxis protein CheZ